MHEVVDMKRIKFVAEPTLRTASPLLGPLVMGAALACAFSPPAPAQTDSSWTFEKDVLPIFQAKCLNCHGADRQKAGLDLRSRAALLAGGETGPAIRPGAAKDSLLWEMLSRDKMPPGKEKLTAAEKSVIRTWLDSGARAQAAAGPKA